VLTVQFTVLGIPCLGLNGGPAFSHSEAFSFQIATDEQAETDRLWHAIVSNGGQESACGWCKDKWGLSWQITPRALMAAISDPDPAGNSRIRIRNTNHRHLALVGDIPRVQAQQLEGDLQLRQHRENGSPLEGAMR
jgi:predicted 3-demethylubiquinone-9 3-methyltransferase (glyoxalase superfamily)